MEDTIISIPIKKLEFAEVQNTSDNLAKAKLYIMHEDLNYNKSVIPLSAIEDAEPTIANIPILAYVRKDEDTNQAEDFAGHELKQTLETVKGELVLKTTFLEQPIGVVPETNNYHYETIDGQQWVVANGFIWKSYSNEAYDLLKKSKTKGISMEIKVLDGSTDQSTGFYVINKFEYLGITVLGDDITPAMGDKAKIKMFSSTKNEYFSRVEQLNFELKSNLEKEVKSLEKATQEFAKNEDQEVVTKANAKENEEILDESKMLEDRLGVKDEENGIEKHSKPKDEADGEQDSQVEDGMDVKQEIKEIDEAEMMSKTKITKTKLTEETTKLNSDLDKEAIKDKADAENFESEEDKEEKAEKCAVEEEDVCDNEPEMMECDEDKKNFAKKKVVDNSESLSINYIVEQITAQLDSVTEQVQVWWQEEMATVPVYYMVDLLIEKKIVVVTNFANTGFYGIPYSVSGDEVILDVTAIVPYIALWKEKTLREESISSLNFEVDKKKTIINSLVEDSKRVYEQLEDKHSELEATCEKLREFKFEVDKKTRFVEIDSLISEFNFSEEEIGALRGMAYSEEISMDALKKELYALEGMRVHNSKTNYSVNKKKNVGYTISNKSETKEFTSKYGKASIYFK